MTTSRLTHRWPGPARWRALAALVPVIPAGFAAKYYRGPSQWWINNWVASFAYEIFFMLLAFIVISRRKAVVPIAAGVCIATCLLEFAQRWTPPWLQMIRATFIGGCVLGNAFTWWDLPAYLIGCILGCLLLRRLAEQADDETQT